MTDGRDSRDPGVPRENEERAVTGRAETPRIRMQEPQPQPLRLSEYLAEGRLQIDWFFIDGHIIVLAGCRRIVAHSYDEAMVMLKLYADANFKERVTRRLKETKKEKLDKDCPTP